MRFKNPMNGHTEEVTGLLAPLWVLLWAPLYYLVKGIWIHAIISFVLAGALAFPTVGIGSLLVTLLYAIFNKRIVRSYYLRKGWVPAD